MMNKTIRFIWIFITIFSLVFSGCDKNLIYTRYYKIPQFNWKYENKIRFNFEIKDTKSDYEISLHLRNASIYPFSNIWVNVEILDSKGKSMFINRYEFTLADETGRWLGKGLGDIIDNQYLIIDKIHFDKKGNYTALVNHEMRIDVVPGIMDVGLSVRKTRKS